MRLPWNTPKIEQLDLVDQASAGPVGSLTSDVVEKRVDTQTAADILGDLRQVLRTRTSLIIAHRIATVKDADWLVVMDQGQIVEQGTHTNLIAKSGMYAQMVERELHRDEDDDDHDDN